MDSLQKQERPDNAPGCFGAATVFRNTSQVCQNCPVFEPCGPAALATLERIRATVDVTDLIALHRKQSTKPIEQAVVVASIATPAVETETPKPMLERKTPIRRVVFDIDADQQAILENMPKKPREIAERLLKQNILQDMQKVLQEGRNPFATAKPEFMRVVSDCLLKGGASRSVLKQSFLDQLGWREGAAASHVSISVSILLSFGIAIDNAGKLELVQ